MISLPLFESVIFCDTRERDDPDTESVPKGYNFGFVDCVINPQSTIYGYIRSLKGKQFIYRSGDLMENICVRCECSIKRRYTGVEEFYKIGKYVCVWEGGRKREVHILLKAHDTTLLSIIA